MNNCHLHKSSPHIYKPMPRATLPSALANLKLFDVTLTQHTEEDLLVFYYKELEEFKKYGQMVLERKDRWIGTFMLGSNPYAKFNWKSTTSLPERVEFDWAIGVSWLEDKIPFLMKFKHDIYLLDRVFGYEESKEGFRELLYDVEKITSMNTEYDLDFKRLDSGFFKKSHEDWKKKNEDYLETIKLSHEHSKGEHTMEYWKNVFPIEHPEFFLEHIKPKLAKCKACQGDYQAELDRKELEKMKKEEESQCPSPAPTSGTMTPTVTHVVSNPVQCNLCDLTFPSKSVYEYHCKKSVEHQTKARYCTCCETQCRSDIEYANHLNTRKHKLKSGEVVDPDEYACEACTYTTKNKGNYERHCKSKGHLQIVGAQ